MPIDTEALPVKLSWRDLHIVYSLLYRNEEIIFKVAD